MALAEAQGLKSHYYGALTDKTARNRAQGAPKLEKKKGNPGRRDKYITGLQCTKKKKKPLEQQGRSWVIKRKRPRRWGGGRV